MQIPLTKHLINFENFTKIYEQKGIFLGLFPDHWEDWYDVEN